MRNRELRRIMISDPKCAALLAISCGNTASFCDTFARIHTEFRAISTQTEKLTFPNMGWNIDRVIECEHAVRGNAVAEYCELVHTELRCVEKELIVCACYLGRYDVIQRWGLNWKSMRANIAFIMFCIGFGGCIDCLEASIAANSAYSAFAEFCVAGACYGGQRAMCSYVITKYSNHICMSRSGILIVSNAISSRGDWSEKTPRITAARRIYA